MSVFSLKCNYSSKNREHSSLKKSETFIQRSPSSAYCNLRNKLISLDLSSCKRSHFLDFMETFKRKNLILTTAFKKNSHLKSEILNFSSNSASKPSANLARTLEKTYFSLRKGRDSEGYFEMLTDAYKPRTLNQENDQIKIRENQEKKPELLITASSEKSENFCSKCAAKLLPHSDKLHNNSSIILSAKIEDLFSQVSEIIPELKSQFDSLRLKKEDISKFYDNQIAKITNFYDELIQSLQSEKMAVVQSFQNHETRALETYQGYEREIRTEEADLKDLENKIRDASLDNLEEISAKVQEKIRFAKINMKTRNKEFLSIFRIGGLNEKRMLSLKKRLFPLFEIVQLPTSIVKKNSRKSQDYKERTSDYYFSFEGSAPVGNGNSKKFQTILEKIRRNQARNSELYMKPQESRIDLRKKLSKAKSMPTFLRIEMKTSEEPLFSLIENLKDREEKSGGNTEDTSRRKIYRSPNFKEK